MPTSKWPAYAVGYTSVGVVVDDEGLPVLYPAVRLNFVGTGVTVTDDGAGGAVITISGATVGTVTGTGTTGKLTKWSNGAGGIIADSLISEATTIVTITGTLVVSGTTLTIRSIAYTFPAADAAGALTSNGSGILSWTAAGAGTVTGTGTTGKLTKFSNGAGGVLADSLISEATTIVTITGTLVVSGTDVTIRAVPYTWPAADGAGVLTSNGSGVLSWAAGGGGISGLSTGTIPKAASASTLTDSILVETTGIITVGGEARATVLRVGGVFPAGQNVGDIRLKDGATIYGAGDTNRLVATITESGGVCAWRWGPAMRQEMQNATPIVFSSFGSTTNEASIYCDFTNLLRINAVTYVENSIGGTRRTLLTAPGLLIANDLAVAGVALDAATAIHTPAGTTAKSSIRLPHGAAPTSPVNGDMWTTTAGLYVQINGSTVGPLS